jgi:hypothetical protein
MACGIAGEGELVHGAGAALSGQGEAEDGHGVQELRVEGGEGEEFWSVRYARAQQCDQFTGERCVLGTYRGKGHNVSGGRGKSVGALDADLTQDGLVWTTHILNGAAAEAAIENEDAVSGGAIAEHFSDEVERQCADAELVRVSVGQAQVQLVAWASAAVTGEVNQQCVFCDGRILA